MSGLESIGFFFGGNFGFFGGFGLFFAGVAALWFVSVYREKHR